MFEYGKNIFAILGIELVNSDFQLDCVRSIGWESYWFHHWMYPLGRFVIKTHCVLSLLVFSLTLTSNFVKFLTSWRLTVRIRLTAMVMLNVAGFFLAFLGMTGLIQYVIHLMFLFIRTLGWVSPDKGFIFIWNYCSDVSCFESFLVKNRYAGGSNAVVGVVDVW